MLKSLLATMICRNSSEIKLRHSASCSRVLGGSEENSDLVWSATSGSPSFGSKFINCWG